MARIQFGLLRSNWETVIFRLIKTHVDEKRRMFSLSDIMRAWEKADKGLLMFLELMGHKDKLKAPEAEIRGAMQKMRDKKWLEFYDRGTYRLTDEGYSTLLKIREYNKQLAKEIEKEEQLAEYGAGKEKS